MKTITMYYTVTLVLLSGCATHRDFSRIDLNGTYQVVSVEGKHYTRLLRKELLEPGQTVTIKQNSTHIVFSGGSKDSSLSLADEQAYMKSRTLIYEPRGDASIVLGPGISQHYDQVFIRKDKLKVESKNFECGLLFFLIPWSEGGTTTVELRKL